MAFASVGAYKSFGRPLKTATADTAFTSLIPPARRLRTKLTKTSYTAGGTAHTLTCMTPLARTYVYSAAAAAATSLVIARDPGNYSANALADGRPFTPSTANNLIAANDYIVVMKPDGTFLVTQPSGASTDATTGRVTLTVSALPTGGIAANAPVWFLGAIGDTNPQTAEAHFQFTMTASTTTTIGDGIGAFLVTPSFDEPILLHSGNATAAGTLLYATGIYGP